MPLVAPGRVNIEGGEITSPVPAAALPSIQPGRIRIRGGTVSVAGASPTPTPLPTIVVRRYQGPTLLDTSQDAASGLADCNLGPIEQRPNQATACTLTIPLVRPDLLGLLIDQNLEGITPIQGCAVEILVDGTLLPRMNVTGARRNGPAVEVSLADRRYELDRRFVGRVGERPNLTPIFFATDGVPDGWAVNGSISAAPSGLPGPFGPSDTAAMQFDGDGTDNTLTATVTPAPVPFDRVFGVAGWFFFPHGAYTYDPTGLLCTLTVVDLGTGLPIDFQPTSVPSKNQPEDRWLTFNTETRIPAGASYQITVTLVIQTGTTYLSDVNTFIQEGLYWVGADIGRIMRDLVAHAYDFAYSHADTGLRATTASIPNTGQTTTRTIVSDEKQQVSSALTEMLAMGHLWDWVEARSDGTDLLHTTQGAVCEIRATPDIANLESWEWPGDRASEVLGLFSPAWSDFTGDRLITTIGPDGIITDRGARVLYGRERYQVGPYGGASPDAFAALVTAVYRRENAALTATVKLAPTAAVLAAALTGGLRPGNFVDVDVDELVGRFRIVNVSTDINAGVSINVNRESV